MKTSLISSLLACLITSNAAQASNTIAEARMHLKNYGFTQCLSEQYPEQSDIRMDLDFSIAFFNSSAGDKYTTPQSEKTLEPHYDPYQATKEFYLSAYENTHGASKYTNKKIMFYACLVVYNSEKLDDFIKTNGTYIRR